MFSYDSLSYYRFSALQEGNNEDKLSSRKTRSSGHQADKTCVNPLQYDTIVRFKG